MVRRTLKIFTPIWLGLEFLIAQVPSIHAELPSNDGSPPVVVIDLHTHVFNARDLPLAGAIDAMGRSWVSKPVADVLKEALLALTAADDLEGPFPPEGKPAGDSGIMSLDGKAAVLKTATPQNLTESQRAKVRALAGRKPEAGVRLMGAESQAEADRKLVADVLPVVAISLTWMRTVMLPAVAGETLTVLPRGIA